MTPSWSPSYTAVSTASRVTSPPSLRPLPSGIGSSGSVNSTVGPSDAVDSSTWKATRIAMIRSASLRNAPYDRPHGAGLRRAATTTPATARMSSSGTGFCVRLAAAARPIAHSHQAAGWRFRG